MAPATDEEECEYEGAEEAEEGGEVLVAPKPAYLADPTSS